MSDAATPGGRTATRAERRSPEEEPRLKVMRFRVNEDESREIRKAAEDAGLAYGAFVARSALAAARNEIPTTPDPFLQVLLEQLKTAANEANRIGINFNKAVTRMNAVGLTTQKDLDRLTYCFEAVQRLDEIGVEIGRRLK